jgi:hypothetical protein
MDDTEAKNRPHPREPFGHPAVAPLRDRSSDDAPGYDADAALTAAVEAAGRVKDAGLRGEALPPRIAGAVPRESLAARAARTKQS